MHQLAAGDTPISGLISVNSEQTAKAFYKNCTWLSLKVVLDNQTLYNRVKVWLNQQPELEEAVFFVVGNTRIVTSVSGLLKSYGVSDTRLH